MELVSLMHVEESSLCGYFWADDHCSVPNRQHARAQGFPGSSAGKESACNAGDSGLISGLGRSLEEGNGYPLQYSCLENSMDRGAWQALWGLRGRK